MHITPEWLSWPETRTLIHALGEDNIRFVGGCVRDAIVARPVQDVDAATVLPPEQTMERLKAQGIKSIPTGIEHGTITAVIGARHFEVTTLRRDVTTDGRHATVAFTDNWQEDAARRDFTMNALYCDASGAITDFFNGIEDAKAGHVRFIGDALQRIREDALRILRFFRFSARYGSNSLNAEGVNACTELANTIATLSGERIQQEMLKLLVTDKAGTIIDAMAHCHVLPHVLGCEVDASVLTYLTSLLYDTQEAPDAILALAALLRSAKGDANQLVDFIHARWKISNAHYKQLHKLCTVKLQLIQHDALIKRQIRVLGKQDFIQLILLYAAEGAEHSAVLAAIVVARAWDIPVFPVTGADLKAHGFAEGKAMGDMLRELETKWEKSGYSLSKDALLRPI